MARIEHKTLIKASLEEAFDYVVELANRPNWIGSVLEVTGISEGPTGVGTSWNEKQKIAGRLFEYRCTIASNVLLFASFLFCITSRCLPV